jgi:hypothetical protein
MYELNAGKLAVERFLQALEQQITRSSVLDLLVSVRLKLHPCKSASFSTLTGFFTPKRSSPCAASIKSSTQVTSATLQLSQEFCLHPEAFRIACSKRCWSICLSG